MTGPVSAGARPWRIVFFGSALFSLPSLEALLEGPDQVALVVSAPPRPAGRGRRLTHVPATRYARENGLELLESDKPNAPEIRDYIASLEPDLLVVAAYGAMLGKSLLETGRIPPVNVHPSLLPRHRGPAPVNWALINGDRETGVSVMLLEAGMDTGAVLAQTRRPVLPYEGAGELAEKLARDGADLLALTIKKIKDGSQPPPRPQDPLLATTNRLLEKKDGYVDFSRPASECAGRINGCDPWPGARARLGDGEVLFFSAAHGPGSFPPGKVEGLSPEGALAVGCGEGLLYLKELQAAGKRRMPAYEFFQGRRPEAFASL
ncbi:MAG: methionyl-tRNA formyltransferase [Deltaproteobacteria bacterium]|nr:methionyl-tRNA formyltransferase [Deltaproteobacteria bacterium]